MNAFKHLLLIVLSFVSLACEETTSQPCSVPDEPTCAEDERLSSEMNQNGCEVFVCVPLGPTECPMFDEPTCAEDEMLSLQNDERGCPKPVCVLTRDDECPDYSEPVCEEGEMLTIQGDDRGCPEPICVEGVSRPSPRELIQEFAGPLVGPEGAVGLVVAVVTPEHTEVIGLGTRVIEGEPVNAQTVFQIGSISKVVTGLLLATMIESPDYSLQADDPVNQYLQGITAPDFEGQPITLEQLVTHYSSLPNFPDNLMGPMTSPGLDYSRDLLGDFLARHALTHAPGSQYSYSNLGSGLLGLALADAAGLSSYPELLNRLLITPLNLTRTGTHLPDFLTRVGENISTGYGGPNQRTDVGIADMGVLDGAGEILSSGEDMATFLKIICGLTPYPVERAVLRSIQPRESGEGMTDIGYGWDISPGASPRWSKTGLTPGFTAYVELSLGDQMGVIILSNRAAHRDIKEAVQAILNALISQ